MINREKLLLLLGIPAECQGLAVRHEDVTVISMKSGHSFTGDDIKQEIANSIKEIGQSPEYIISDQGHNLVNRIVKSSLPNHIDISHAMGTCLKHAIGNQADFVAFTFLLGKIRLQYHLTDKAYLFIPESKDLLEEVPASVSTVRHVDTICKTEGFSVDTCKKCQDPENEHILCWCHVRAKFKLAFDISKDNDAGWFVEQIGRLYAVELENRLLNRTDEQIEERRNRVDVTEILNKMLCRANRMLQDKRIHFGEMMNTALNYMAGGWEKLLNYRYDGRYDIDNLEAERKIRPLTIGRKNTLFFGSEEGVEVATTYYTLIETAKLNGLSPMYYLTHVFRQLMEGNKNYESILSGKLALQAI